MRPDSRYSLAEHKVDSILEVLRGRSQGILLRENDRLLQGVLDDLANAVEELRAAHGEVYAQREELAEACRKVQREHQRYVELFEDAPDGYVVTDLHGVIEQANLAAAELFDSARDFIVGKPLALFVDKVDKTAFFQQLNKMDTLEAIKDWELRLQPWKGTSFWASINLAKVQISEHEDISLRWLIRDITSRKQAEEFLRRYALLAGQGRDIILFIRRDDGRILEANAAAVKAYGYGYETLLTMTIHDLRAPDTRMLTQGQMDEAESRGILFETFHRRKDGSIFPVEVSSRGETIEGARTLISVVRNITQRKRTEDIIHVRLNLLEFATSHSVEELLQKILDEICALLDSPIGFLHFVESDQKTLSLQAWSTRTLDTFCTVEGKGAHYPIEKAGVWVDCVRERRPVIHNDYPALPHRKGLPDGHPPVIREISIPIMRSGRVEAILGIGNKPEDYTQEDIEAASYLADIAWEITRHRRVEEELRENQSRLDLALRSAHMGVWDLDLKENKRRFDYQVCHLLGIDPAEFTGTEEEFYKALHPDDRDMVKAAWARTIEQDMPYETEYRAFRPDGSVRYLTARGKVVRDGKGRPVRINGLIWDISERKRMEEELRKSHDELELRVQERTVELNQAGKRLRSLASELLNSGENERKLIAQEIHDGLSSQLAAIKFCMERELFAERDAGQSGESIKRSCAMIQNAMEETRRIMANLRPSILDDLGILPTLTWLCREFQEMNPSIDPVIKFEISEEDIPADIKTVIFRLLQEALNNIRKYSRAERVEISLRMIGSSIVFLIKDNGQGFNPKKVLSGRKIGCGFGLRGMLERVELSGGKCDVKSAPGKGVSIWAEWNIKS